MSVDIRHCEIYAFWKGQTALLKNNIKSISYNINAILFFVMNQKYSFKLH